MADFATTACADILERLPVGVFTVNPDWRIGYWNVRMAAWTGIGSSRAIGRPLGEILPRLAEAHNLSRLEPVMAGGPPVIFSWQLHHDLFPKSHGGHPKPEARTELGRRREAESALQRALVAKDDILRESNHRIKNNLVMVASLVSLEEERAPNKAARHFLVDLGSRVRSIGLLHELLYARPSEEYPRLDEYLSRLSTTLVGSYLGEAGVSRLSLELEALSIPASQAIKVGLILDELLTNALKYGGSPEAPPAIAVRLGLFEDDRIELLVTDDGPGFPPHWRESRDSLGGIVDFLPGPGGRVRARFPLPAATGA